MPESGAPPYWSPATGRCTRPIAEARPTWPSCCRGSPDARASWTWGSARRSPRSPRRCRRSRARRSGSSPRTCTRSRRARYTGEVSAADAARARRRRGGPRSLASAGATTGRPTARSRRRCSAALEAGLEPILCVGETEAERDDGRDRAAAAPPGPGGPRARPGPGARADVVIAYEPVWAIGTGRSATAGAGPGGDRLHPRAGRRPLHRGGRERVRVLYGGSVKPRERGRASWPARTSTARWWAARASRRPSWLPSRRRPPRAARRGVSLPAGPGPPPVPSVCLVVLDGWGLAEPGPGNAVALGGHPGVRRALGAPPPHDAHHLRRGGRAAGGADGQLRGRPPEPRRRRGGSAGPDAHRRRGGRRLVRRERGAARRLRRPGARPAALHLLGPGLRRGRPLRHGATCAH